MFNFKLFQKKRGAETREDSTSQAQAPTKELFVEEVPPRPGLQPEATEIRPTKLAAFLGQDYWTMGRRDGYLYHSAEGFELWRKKIKAEFLLVMDQLIQEKSEQRLVLRNHLSSIGSMHEVTSTQLHNTIHDLEADAERLTAQKELAAVDEGWIMGAVHSYQLGFTQGLREYVESENLVKSSSLF